MRIQGKGWTFAIAVCAVLVQGCPKDSEGTDTGKDVVQTDEGSDAVSPDLPVDTPTDTVVTAGKCLECLAPGIAMRFTKLNVLEPSEPMGLPEFLNAIWAPDIDDSRLNVVLRIDKIEDPVEGSGAAKTLTVTVGSAWHELTAGVPSTVDQVIEVGGHLQPVEYYFLNGATNQFRIDLNADCTFKSVGDANLYFHPGPIDHGLICSGGDTSLDPNFVTDRIPMNKLAANGHFNDTCTGIDTAYLRGCIAEEAACQICSFGPAPDYSAWKIEKDSTAANEKCAASYCAFNCAKGLWVNFGGFVSDLGVPLACDYNGSGANNGYLIAGDWEAESVPFGVEPTN